MTTPQKLAVTYTPIERLKAAKRNARTHSNLQIRELTASIGKYGWTSPIFTDEKGVIIAGHGRLAAAKALKMKQVPVIVLKGLSPEKKRALAIADNRIPLNAGWDQEMLAAELRELQEVGTIEMDSLGFKASELEHLLDGAKLRGGKESVEFTQTYAVIVELKSEREQTSLLKRLTKDGYECKALMS